MSSCTLNSHAISTRRSRNLKFKRRVEGRGTINVSLLRRNCDFLCKRARTKVCLLWSCFIIIYIWSEKHKYVAERRAQLPGDGAQFPLSSVRRTQWKQVNINKLLEARTDLKTQLKRGSSVGKAWMRLLCSLWNFPSPYMTGHRFAKSWGLDCFGFLYPVADC